jgi:tetratricopeptide (TPR) repeat protein
MAGLLRDRYFEYAPDRAWDLLTGESVSPPNEPQHDAGECCLACEPVIELLDHGREGSPRWFALEATPRQWRLRARSAAAAARRRGYVAIAVDVFLRMRLLLADDLSTRAMMLIARPGSSADRLQAALLHAAAISSGPHVLLTCPARLKAATTRSPATGRTPTRWHAAEARTAYSPGRLRVVTPLRVPEDVARLLDRARRASDLVQRGRHASAERLLRESAAALVRRRVPGPAAETYIALGRMLLERGSLDVADKAFAEAALLAEGVDGRLLAAARIWQAAARTDAGQLSAAESLCRAVLITIAEDDEERSRAEATLGRVLVWQDRITEAVALPFTRTASTDAFVAATSIRVLVEAGELFEAGRRARELMDRMKDHDATSQVIALGAHLRVLLAAGDLSLAAEALHAAAGASRAARTPLRLARLRLLWSQALRRAGRTQEGDRELRALTRMRSAMPPLLRAAIDRCARPSPAGGGRPHASAGDAADLVLSAQREEDDREALTRICEFVQRATRATRVEIWTADAGPATAVVTCGGGLGTQLGARALEAGTLIGPEAVASGREIAMPIRLGPQLMGALAVRWPADRSSAGDADGLLTLACAVAAPRVDALVSVSRDLAHTASAIPELIGVSAAIADVRRVVSRAAVAPFSVRSKGRAASVKSWSREPSIN